MPDKIKVGDTVTVTAAFEDSFGEPAELTSVVWSVNGAALALVTAPPLDVPGGPIEEVPPPVEEIPVEESRYESSHRRGKRGRAREEEEDQPRQTAEEVPPVEPPPTGTEPQLTQQVLGVAPGHAEVIALASDKHGQQITASTTIHVVQAGSIIKGTLTVG